MTVTASTTSRLCISGGRRISLARRSLPPHDQNERGRTGSRALEITNDVGHTGLVTKEGGEVDGLLGVVLQARENKPSAPDFFDQGKSGRTMGKDFAFPRWRAARFLGRKPRDPCLEKGEGTVSTHSSQEGRRGVPGVLKLSVRHGGLRRGGVGGGEGRERERESAPAEPTPTNFVPPATASSKLAASAPSSAPNAFPTLRCTRSGSHYSHPPSSSVSGSRRNLHPSRWRSNEGVRVEAGSGRRVEGVEEGEESGS